MSKIVTSNSITFVDTSDNRKLDVYITSNLPTTQIKNSNTGTYTPDWSSTNLILSADVYLDSSDVTDNDNTSVIWYEQIGDGTKTPIGTSTSITIRANKMTNNAMVTYSCEATYDEDITASARQTFTRVDTGKNGADGTSVSIKGTATSVAPVTGTDYYTVVYSNSSLTLAEEGDAYVYNGDLYVCVGLQAGNGADYFINVGRIQGPAGQDAKSIVLSGDSQVFKVGQSNTVDPPTIKVTAKALNTSVASWAYSTDGGQTFQGSAPTEVSISGNIAIIDGVSLASNSLTIKVSDGEIEDVFTVYKVFDGDQGTPAPIAFLTNENITFSADSQGRIASTTVTSNVVAYNGTTKVLPTLGTISGMPSGMTIESGVDNVSKEMMLTITIADKSTLNFTSGTIYIPVTSPVSTVLSLNWSKVNAGATGATGSAGAPAYTALLTNESHVFAGDVANAIGGSATTQVIAYKGTTAQTVIISSINGKAASTVDTDTGIAGLKFKCSALSGTSPTITFTCTTSFVSANGTIPIVFTVDGVSFTKMFTYSIAFKGNTGSTGSTGPTGSPGVPATSYWLISSASAVQKTSTGTITVTPSTLTFTGKSQTGTATPTDYACRWIIAYSTDGTNYTNLYTSSANETSKSITVATTYKTIRARMYLAGGTSTLLDEQIIPIVSDGAKGDTGNGINSVTVTYGISTSASTQPTSWQSTIPTVAEGSYLWTRTVIDYTDDSIADTVAYTYAKQGTKGDTGSQGTSVTVSSIQYQAGTSSTTAPTGTWSNSVVSVAEGSYLWTKTAFSDGKTAYGVAKQGAKGDKGETGRGVSSIVEQYYQSTSATAQSGGSWSTTVPTWVDGKYIWTRSVITYTDTTTSTTSPICITGQKGATGGTGASGVGVSSVDVWYYQSSSATSLCGGSWVTTAPTWVDGKYIWTKTITTYTNNTTDETNAVCITGQKGSTGVAAVTFQIYATNGYLLTKDISEITLQTFAYEGSTAITSGATYQWSQFIDDEWANISGATSATYTVTQADVLKSKSYRCVMTYKSQTYISTATVQDKTDLYNSIMCISSNATNNDCYWVLYTLVYSDTEEVDPLLGPISITAPSSPVSGDYWYAVDSANATVTLKKHNGTSWENSTDKQSLSYYWDMINDGSTQIPLGDSAKVKVVSCHDFTATATLVCEVSNLENGLLTQSSLSLTDASDPIVSVDEPTTTVNGQIWIKPNNNGTYLMFVWDEVLNSWISSDMDTRNKVYTNRPSSYNVGDLWITASDTDHGSYLHGTLLQAQKSNTTYSASDWSPTLRYEQDIDEMKNTLNDLAQYVSITSAGLRIGARNTSGELSPFTSLFTSTELSFYQNSEKLLTLANNQLTAPRIVVEDNLEVQGSISLGDLKMIIESNGSFSIAVQK